MKKNELFGLKNMFPSNNIASVGVKISSPHTEGVFYCSSYTTQTHTRAVYIILFQYFQSQLDEVKVGFDLYCCTEFIMEIIALPGLMRTANQRVRCFICTRVFMLHKAVG